MRRVRNVRHLPQGKGKSLGASYPKTYNLGLDFAWKGLGEVYKSWGGRRKARSNGSVKAKEVKGCKAW